MATNKTIILGIGSRTIPIIKSVSSWRKCLTDHARPFVSIAYIKDDGTAVLSSHENTFKELLLNGLQSEMKSNAWQQNRAIAMQRQKSIKTWAQTVFQTIRKEAYAREASLKGMHVPTGLTAVLVSTTFDPVGSTLLLFFAEIMQQVAKESNLLFTIHFYQIAPDLYYHGIKGVSPNYVLNREDYETAGLRTVKHLQEIQDAYLQPVNTISSGKRPLNHCWLVSNSTERGSCLNDFSVIAQSTVNFINILQHPSIRLPDLSGKLTMSGEAPFLSSLGISELRMARSVMKKAFRIKMMEKSLSFIDAWQNKKYERQKIDSEIRRLINDHRLDMIRERFSCDDNGKIFFNPFRFQMETDILLGNKEVDSFFTDIHTAWQEYRRNNETLLFEKTVMKQEKLVENDSTLIMEECQKFVCNFNGEIPAGIAYLSDWLNTGSSFVKGSNISMATGFQEIWVKVTSYWDDLMDTQTKRMLLQSIRQSINDKTSLLSKMENQLETSQKIFQSKAMMEKQNSGGDSSQHLRRLEIEIEELVIRGQKVKSELEDLINREKDLLADLRTIDKGLEDPGTRRRLFQVNVEDKAQEDFINIAPKMREAAEKSQQMREEEKLAEKTALKKFQRWFLVHNALIVLAAILCTGFFMPGLKTIIKTILPITVFAIFINTLIGAYIHFFISKRAWLKSCARLREADSNQRQTITETILIFANLEKSRADFAACFYAIEWYHALREILSNKLLELASGLKSLEKMKIAAQKNWDHINLEDTENIKTFPTKLQVKNLWETKREAAANMLYLKKPGENFFKNVLNNGAANALKSLKIFINQSVEELFQKFIKMDLAELLEYLDKNDPSFDLDKTLRSCINNAGLLVAVHEFAYNHGAIETLLVGLRHHEDGKISRMLNTGLKEKNVEIIQTDESDRIFLVRLLLKFAPSHWIYYDIMHQIEKENNDQKIKPLSNATILNFKN